MVLKQIIIWIKRCAETPVHSSNISLYRTEIFVDKEANAGVTMILNMQRNTVKRFVNMKLLAGHGATLYIKT